MARKQIGFHDAGRSTGITWMALRGDDPLKIQCRAGHQDFATTQGYIREAENLTCVIGVPFPPLPAALLAQSSYVPSEFASERALDDALVVETTTKILSVSSGIRNLEEGAHHTGFTEISALPHNPTDAANADKYAKDREPDGTLTETRTPTNPRIALMSDLAEHKRNAIASGDLGLAWWIHEFEAKLLEAMGPTTGVVELAWMRDGRKNR